jgi:hypothetical protein
MQNRIATGIKKCNPKIASIRKCKIELQEASKM